MLWNDRTREVLWQRSRMVRYIRECEHVGGEPMAKTLLTDCSLPQEALHRG
jgi:hypothetical protein